MLKLFRALVDFLTRSGGLTGRKAASCLYKYYNEEAGASYFPRGGSLDRSSWARRKFSGSEGCLPSGIGAKHDQVLS